MTLEYREEGVFRDMPSLIFFFFAFRNLKLNGGRTMAWERERKLCTDDLISWGVIVFSLVGLPFLGGKVG